MGKKPIVSVTYENERISIKNSSPSSKCVLRLSCVVCGPIYGRRMGFYVNGFLSTYKVYQEPINRPFTQKPIKRPHIGPWTTQERRNTHFK